MKDLALVKYHDHYNKKTEKLSFCLRKYIISYKYKLLIIIKNIEDANNL